MKRLFLILTLLLALACMLVACDNEETVDDDHIHTYGEWSVNTLATCVTKGEEKRTCTCGESETREVEATGKHNYGNWNVTSAATCVAKGVETRICACGASEMREIEAKGHRYGTDNTCLNCQTAIVYTEGLEYILNGDQNSYTVAVGSATSVANIVIPPYHEGKPVTAIRDYAFRHCISLTAIEIPACVTSIGARAFEYCEFLASIEIPASVSVIGEYAFSCCTSLAIINIPAATTFIASSAFWECTALTGVYISDIAAWCNIVCGDPFSNPLHFAENLYLSNILVTNLVIPSTVNTIRKYAFENCTSIMSVTFENIDSSQLTSIEDRAFRNCPSLVSLEMPESVTSIGDGVFLFCTSLSTIAIPSGVTAIGERAFLNCTALMSVTFAETSGWSAEDSDAVSSVELPATALADPTTAATYLKSTYLDYCWKRT